MVFGGILYFMHSVRQSTIDEMVLTTGVTTLSWIVLARFILPYLTEVLGAEVLLAAY